MAKSNVFPTPLLRVSRPVSACQRCRSAKIKCDGKLPACTACERAGRSEECSSANDQFAKGKERSYVASLETRIERLERQITQAKGRKASIDMIAIASAAAYVPSPMPSAGSRKSEKQEARNVDDLVSDFGFLSVNATARDFHGFTGEMSFARLVLSTSSLEAIPIFPTFSLPQRYEVAPLFQHYLENVHVVYPFLPEARLYASIDAVYGQSGLYASPMDHWNTLMVLAVSCASLARIKGDTRYQDAVKYAAAALKYVESVVQPGSMSGIQAILLMVLLALWLPHHFNSWYLIGVASRVAVDLGLHQNPPPELRLQGPEIVTRLRVYDCVYSLDRSISMVHQRSFSFTDDSTNVTHSIELPRTDKAQSPFHIGLEPAINLVKLRRIQSPYYQMLFQSQHLPKTATWPIMCQSIHDIGLWYSSLVTVAKEVLRHHSHCEVLYSNVLMLTPRNWLRELPEYGKFLVLQYAEKYADSIYSATSSVPEGCGLYTSHDLLRVSFVAQRFVTLMAEDYGLFFSESTPSLPPSASKSATPPAITTTWAPLKSPTLSRHDNSEQLIRVYDCLGRFETAIEYFSSKYGYTDPLYEFQMSSRSLKQKLQSWTGSSIQVDSNSR